MSHEDKAEVRVVGGSVTLGGVVQGENLDGWEDSWTGGTGVKNTD